MWAIERSLAGWRFSFFFISPALNSSPSGTVVEPVGQQQHVTVGGQPLFQRSEQTRVERVGDIGEQTADRLIVLLERDRNDCAAWFGR